MPKRLTTLAAGLLLSVASMCAWSHTTIQQIEPASGSVLTASPAVIAITFEHRVQLTSVVVASEGQAARKLRFEPVGSALTFTLPDPVLAPGRNELRWKALSGDGHVIEGTIEYVVAPAD